MVDQPQPIYVFHHIPKCGGTSVRALLSKWFQIIEDYRKGWTMDYPEKANLSAMQPHQCLCGHFELEGYHLYQRYPEAFTSDRYRVFTFVRDPLQVRLSLFRYAFNKGQAKHKSIDENLRLGIPNFIARMLPVTLDNYKTVLDKYFFIGVLERGQANIDLLATKLGKPTIPLPWANKTGGHDATRLEIQGISEDILEQFKRDNALDYLIYDYCKERFEKEVAMAVK